MVDGLTNRAPLAFQRRVLARWRLLARTDEIAHADFVERTITRYSDVAIDEARFVEKYGHSAGRPPAGGVRGPDDSSTTYRIKEAQSYTMSPARRVGPAEQAA